MKQGDKIKLDGTNWQGFIKEILADGFVMLSLDNGLDVRAPKDRVIVLKQDENGNAMRDDKGRFVPGHKRLGGIRKGGKSMRQTRMELLEQLQPFISNVGEIIEMIDEPQEKILALTRMMKFCVPTYSAIEYSEKTPRPLTAEEKLAQINAKYNNKPDPIKEEEE